MAKNFTSNKVMMLMLAFILIFAVTGCSGGGAAVKDPSELSFKAGTYTGVGVGKNGNIEVEVEFTDSKIQGVKVLNHSETQGISEPAIEKLPEKIIEEQSLAVDAITGATFTSKGILQGVEDCAVQAGGNLAILKQKKEKAVNGEVEEVTVDVVVVGAGAAGAAAALAAADNGAEVLLLEKTASPMGSGTLAGGMFAADSRQQKASNSTVSKEWLYNQYLQTSSGYMNSILVRTIIEESGKTVDWLEDNGMKLNLVDAGTGLAFEHVGMPRTLHGYVEGGTVAITNLIKTFEAKSGQVRFNTPATELHYDQTGNVAGVLAKKEDGSTLKVNAKAVIIATGGFGGNEEMLKEYFGHKYTLGQVMSNTGDGIKMAWDAGADKYGIDTTHYFAQIFTAEEIPKLIEKVGDSWYSLTKFSLYPGLRINTLGQRFSDETKSTLFSVHGAEIHMQPKQTEFVIIDSAMLNTIKEKGWAAIEPHFETWRNNRQFYMEFNEPNDTDVLLKEENTPTDFTSRLEAALGTGVVFKADTLEELAKQMGVDEQTFMSSVKQYNGAIDKGEDTLFFADTSRLIPVKEGPYYAVKYVSRNLSTLGGVRINEKIQAVDEEGLPIPGLYVAGADAGGMYGKAYIDFEGGTLGFAYTSGRLAGINAAAYTK